MEEIKLKIFPVLLPLIYLLVIFAVPYGFIFIKPKEKKKNYLLSIIICTVVVWILLLFTRLFIELPYNLAVVDDITYDGVGGNAGTLVLGWIPGLLISTVFYLINKIIQLFKKS